MLKIIKINNGKKIKFFYKNIIDIVLKTGKTINKIKIITQYLK